MTVVNENRQKTFLKPVEYEYVIIPELILTPLPRMMKKMTHVDIMTRVVARDVLQVQPIRLTRGRSPVIRTGRSKKTQ